MEKLNEAKKSIKRKYGKHKPIKIYEKGKVRNKVIKFVGNIGGLTEEYFLNYLTSLQEDSDINNKKFNGKTWYKNNNKYFKKYIDENGLKKIKLSKFGNRVFDIIKNKKSNKNTKLINENFISFDNFIKYILWDRE